MGGYALKHIGSLLVPALLIVLVQQVLPLLREEAMK